MPWSTPSSIWPLKVPFGIREKQMQVCTLQHRTLKALNLWTQWYWHSYSFIKLHLRHSILLELWDWAMQECRFYPFLALWYAGVYYQLDNQRVCIYHDWKLASSWFICKYYQFVARESHNKSDIIVVPGAPYTYNCTFPTMIDDWRAKWYQYSGGQTDPLFPFGFVQVCILLLIWYSVIDIMVIGKI